MSFRKPIIVLQVLACVLLTASQSRADISNAAVLFLRIAPGARAAGMGEAFVAIADDATATHYNPAGLGAYPLSQTWADADVPSQLSPLRAMAALSRDGGSQYDDYDIWALTAKGLARYDQRRWHLAEVFSTKTDQTVHKIVSSYFNEEDPDRLARMVSLVAQSNNSWTLPALQEFQNRVMNAIPPDFKDLDLLRTALDSLMAAYEQCLINWEKVSKAREFFQKGMEDSVLSQDEAFSISLALERSKNRFIPEELVIPYATLFDTEPHVIVSSSRELVVGTSDGLYAFNGRRWLTLSEAEELPSRNILSLHADGSIVYVGTDSGLAKFAGHQVTAVDGKEQLPVGPVTAIGSQGSDNVWVMVGGDLYHWDGQKWSNSFDYTVALEDTRERIAERFAIYGTAGERVAYLAKFDELNQELPSDIPYAEPEDTLLGPKEVAPAEEGAEEPDSAVVDSMESRLDAPPGALAPGMLVRAPFLARVNGTVSAIHVSFDDVWLGTDHGVLRFNFERWMLPGYWDHVVEEGETIEALVPFGSGLDFVEDLRRLARVCQVNELECQPGEPLPVNEQILLPRNPAASPVRAIAGDANKLYFATSDGMIEYSLSTVIAFSSPIVEPAAPGMYKIKPRAVIPAVGWAAVSEKGLDKVPAVGAELQGGLLWLASSDKIAARREGKTEVSLMYAKWLPELADDLYYAFTSFTTNAGSWGTFGGNVTFISYGEFTRTGPTSPEPLGTFDSFDVAFTGSYGTSLTSKMDGGISVKVIYSKLSEQGAGVEKGKGTSTGFAVDFGLLYHFSPRLNLGVAVTNLGPEMAYIDASQSDPLPQNLAVGFAYNLIQTDYYRILVAAQVDKMLVGLGDGVKEELKQVIMSGGAEFLYANIFALRGGYMHDEEGRLKTFTAGVGLYLKGTLRFDFGYYFGDSRNEARKGIKPLSLSISI